MYHFKCENCGAAFEAIRKDRRFCSTQCKNRFKYVNDPYLRVGRIWKRELEFGAKRPQSIPYSRKFGWDRLDNLMAGDVNVHQMEKILKEYWEKARDENFYHIHEYVKFLEEKTDFISRMTPKEDV